MATPSQFVCLVIYNTISAKTVYLTRNGGIALKVDLAVATESGRRKLRTIRGG